MGLFLNDVAIAAVVDVIVVDGGGCGVVAVFVAVLAAVVVAVMVAVAAVIVAVVAVVVAVVAAVVVAAVVAVVAAVLAFFVAVAAVSNLSCRKFYFVTMNKFSFETHWQSNCHNHCDSQLVYEQLLFLKQ